MLIMIRGLPGSGKTYFAKWINRNVGALHLEADMLCIKKGKFVFDSYTVRIHHEAIQEIASIAMKTDSDCIVSNAFVTRKEMLPYIELARYYHQSITIYKCAGAYGSSHKVPYETIERMRSKWEDIPNEITVTEKFFEKGVDEIKKG